MFRKLEEKINNAQFEPGIIAFFTNPFYIARQGLYENIKRTGSSITGRTLDVGCGTKPYENLFNCSEYIGLEFDTGIDSGKKKADYYYDGKTFPFDDKGFDSVIASQVFEHIFNPQLFLKEVNRVLKISGKFLLTVPFVWDEHEQPFDYARYSSFGLNSILNENGFRIIEHTKSINDLRVIAQLLNGYLYKITAKHRIIKRITIVCIMPLVNIFGIILSKIFPSNNDLYLDNIILTEKVKDV